MIVCLLRKCFLIAALLATGMAHGETINWYCTPQTNRTSSGAAMDSGFQFQVGVFTGGFIPTAANASQWVASWTSAQSTSYNATTQAFDDNFTVTGNAAPFTVGAKAYVWGRRTGTTSDEWILFRHASWTWPAPNPMNPFPLDWNAASANEVILGDINAIGIPYLMKSEAVYSYNQWRNDQLAGEPLNGANHDPDRDAVSNLMEFVFGSPPTVPGAPPPTTTSFVDVSGQRHLQISIPRLRNRLAKLTVEVSADLAHWDSGTSFTALVSDSATLLVVRDKTPVTPGAARRFMRVKAELQP